MRCRYADSPSRGPCAGNGGCGINALCQAFFTPELTRKCSCVSGFKPLRMGNQEVAAAMASSQMSSFDNTVCIREDVLPEEQAYYIISMHRERLRYMRESSTGQTTAGHRTPPSAQDATRTHAPSRIGQPAEHYRSPVPATYIPTPLTVGRVGHSWTAASAPMQALPRRPEVNMQYAGSPPHSSAGALPTATISNQAPHPEKQRVEPLARSSCLLGVCFR